MVKDQLITVFCKWGKPKAVRVDNGLPFGSPESSTTPVLALWLIAYGIKVISNKPGCPQENAHVEKMQDTSARWAQVKQCKDATELQQNLNEAVFIQREKYPVTRLGNQTRAQAFPELHSMYRKWKEEEFNPQLVYDFLAKKSYTRKASRNGQITHFTYRIGLGAAYKQLAVTLRLDAQKVEWCIFKPDGEWIKNAPAPYLSRERILNLSVYFNKSKN